LKTGWRKRQYRVKIYLWVVESASWVSKQLPGDECLDGLWQADARTALSELKERIEKRFAISKEEFELTLSLPRQVSKEN